MHGSALKVKQSIMVKEYAIVGLKMLNIAFNNAHKITWIRRLINSESKWTNIAKMYIDSNLLPFCGKIFYEVVSNKCSINFGQKLSNHFQS